ncbi:MAG: phosphonopyruvate decarboxylase [Bdellovibrionales bacterium]|nr:phosphonopyruvate decarboxylase [Bdellovibrionales bacterium]
MIDPQQFLDVLVSQDFSFFAGVPDSLLKDICSAIGDRFSQKSHFITTQEGSAVAMAAGYHLASGRHPLVYMQNSGLGNALNPLVSLAHRDVYSIPILLLIGWRGAPGESDEPQHMAMGSATPRILEALKIPYEELPMTIDEAKQTVMKVTTLLRTNNAPSAILVKPGCFESYELKDKFQFKTSLSREAALNSVVENIVPKDTVFLATTGKLGRELFELRERQGKIPPPDFLNIGAMGHVSQIALGAALNTSKQVVCLDGDGSLLMHLGGLATIGQLAPKNFKHIVFNNGAHESVGGQTTIGSKLNLLSVASSLGYVWMQRSETEDDLIAKLRELCNVSGPAFLEIRVTNASRKTLSRPTTSVLENKLRFMNEFERPNK